LDLDLALDLIIFDKTVNESERILFADNFLNPRSAVEVSPSFLVGASYMTFWKIEGFGNWALTQYHPILGQYRSDDPTIASHHILQAREHGISFFYLDFGWIRPSSRCDLAAQNGLLRVCEEEGISFVPLAKPGFNNTPYIRFGQELRVITRDVQRFQWLLGEARNLSSRPLNMVLIFTWNDFNEGTSIEPTTEYGF
jgi:hypothetical protein